MLDNALVGSRFCGVENVSPRSCGEFKFVQALQWHGYGLSGDYIAQIEVVGEHVSLVMDDSESVFTAQQCVEICENFCRLLIVDAGLGLIRLNLEVFDRFQALEACRDVVMSTADTSGHEYMDISSGDMRGWEYIASADFKRPISSVCGSSYHRVVIAFDEHADLPCISIDGRAFTLNLDETLWLLESLQVAACSATMATETLKLDVADQLHGKAL